MSTFSNLSTLMRGCDSLKITLTRESSGQVRAVFLPVPTDGSGDDLRAVLATPLIVTADQNELDAELSAYLEQAIAVRQPAVLAHETALASLKEKAEAAAAKAATKSAAVPKTSTKDKAQSEADALKKKDEDKSAEPEAVKSEDKAPSTIDLFAEGN